MEGELITVKMREQLSGNRRRKTGEITANISQMQDESVFVKFVNEFKQVYPG